MGANALSGSIASDDISISSALDEINLSYNRLAGTIPRSFQDITINKLDLSHNRITGLLDFYGKPKNIDDSSVKFSYNRLSGLIPAAFIEKYEYADVLMGNR